MITYWLATFGQRCQLRCTEQLPLGNKQPNVASLSRGWRWGPISWNGTLVMVPWVSSRSSRVTWPHCHFNYVLGCLLSWSILTITLTGCALVVFFHLILLLFWTLWWQEAKMIPKRLHSGGPLMSRVVIETQLHLKMLICVPLIWHLWVCLSSHCEESRNHSWPESTGVCSTFGLHPPFGTSCRSFSLAIAKVLFWRTHFLWAVLADSLLIIH